MKKNVRKKAAEQKRQLYITGGGPVVEIKFDDFEEMLLEVIKVNVEVLPSRHDSDNLGTMLIFFPWCHILPRFAQYLNMKIVWSCSNCISTFNIINQFLVIIVKNIFKVNIHDIICQIDRSI